jgi:hypothetical protein
MRAYFNFDDGSFYATGEFDAVVNFKYSSVQLYKKSDTKNTAAYLYSSKMVDVFYTDEDPKYESGFGYIFTGTDGTTGKNRNVKGWIWFPEEYFVNFKGLAEQGGEFRTSITGTQIPPRPASQQQQSTGTTTNPSTPKTNNPSNVEIGTDILLQILKQSQKNDDKPAPETQEEFIGAGMGTPDWVEDARRKRELEEKQQQQQQNSGSGSNNTALIVGGVAVGAIVLLMMTGKKR